MLERLWPSSHSLKFVRKIIFLGGIRLGPFCSTMLSLPRKIFNYMTASIGSSVIKINYSLLYKTKEPAISYLKVLLSI